MVERRPPRATSGPPGAASSTSRGLRRLRLAGRSPERVSRRGASAPRTALSRQAPRGRSARRTCVHAPAARARRLPLLRRARSPAVVEATRDDDDEKNRVCPPSSLGGSLTDWARMNVLGFRAGAAFGAEPDLRAWSDRVALNPARVPPEARSPALDTVLGRLAAAVPPGVGPPGRAEPRPCASPEARPFAPTGRIGGSRRSVGARWRRSTLTPCRPRCCATPPSRPETAAAATPPAWCSTPPGWTTPPCSGSRPTSATPRPRSSSRATTSRTSTTSATSRRGRRCPSAGTRPSPPGWRSSSGARPPSSSSTPRRAW